MARDLRHFPSRDILLLTNPRYMKGEKLTVATLNVRCLGQGFIGRRKRKDIKDIFKYTTHPTDILVLHEVKLPKIACMKQARFIEPKGGTSF